MEHLLEEVIWKHTHIRIKDYDRNLLTFSIPVEYFVSILIELEDNYHLPVIQLLESMEACNFTIYQLSKKLSSAVS